MNDPLFSVSGQTVLVSGASRGIGRALAEAFAVRAAKVIVTGRDADTLQRTATEICPEGGLVRPIVCDVADPQAIERLVGKVLDEFQGVDTLINVAGINRRMPAVELTLEDFDAIMNINLRGAFALSLAIGKSMLELGRGSQINIVSLNNFRPLVNLTPYAVSKAALGQLTRVLALEWGPRGVRVNAIAPGFILTDLSRKLWSDPKMRDWAQTNTPLGRLGETDDLLGAAIFLASPASAFMTGQIVFVDGGCSAGIRWPIPHAPRPPV